MKDFKVSMRFSKGNVRVSSTSSFSSSGLDGVVAGFLSEGLLDREFVATDSAEALGEGRGVETSAGVTEGVSPGAGLGLVAGVSGDGADSTGAEVSDGLAKGVALTSGLACGGAVSLGVGVAVGGVGCGFSLG
jgi:hypothetical protein